MAVQTLPRQILVRRSRTIDHELVQMVEGSSPARPTQQQAQHGLLCLRLDLDSDHIHDKVSGCF